MSKLILKRFHCVEDTDEIGGESPYFLTFVGDIATGQTAFKMTRHGNWHNEVDKGEIWQVNETVASGFDFVPAKTVVLSAMVEEDEGLDVNSGEVNTIHAIVRAKLNDFRSAGAHTVTPGIASSLISAFRSGLTLALLTSSGAADDPMGVRRVTLTGQAGDLPLVSFSGDDGRYRVRYAQA